MILIKKDLRTVTETVHSEERFAIVKLGNCLFINVYLPCVGTCDRFLACEALFEDLWSWRENYPNCECFIGGDFNVDLNGSDRVAQYINSFIAIICLVVTLCFNSLISLLT